MDKLTTRADFEKAVQDNEYTVVKYTADWCPDCKWMERWIGDIVEQHSGKHWFEVDVDALSDVAEENDVRGIPSLLVYKNGEKLAHLHSANAKTAKDVNEFLEEVFGVRQS